MPPPSARETALRGVIVNTVIDGRPPSLDFDLQHFHDLRRIESDSLKLFGCALLGILKRPEYDAAVGQALTAKEPETRLQLAATIARQIHDAESATFDLLRGAGVVAPELARLEQQRECLRYERQERMIVSLRDAERLRPDLDYTSARDFFWMFIGRDIYRMLVRERGWSSQKYQDWLADTLVRSLLDPPRRSRSAAT